MIHLHIFMVYNFSKFRKASLKPQKICLRKILQNLSLIIIDPSENFKKYNHHFLIDPKNSKKYVCFNQREDTYKDETYVRFCQNAVKYQCELTMRSLPALKFYKVPEGKRLQSTLYNIFCI